MAIQQYSCRNAMQDIYPLRKFAYAGGCRSKFVNKGDQQKGNSYRIENARVTAVQNRLSVVQIPPTLLFSNKEKPFLSNIQSGGNFSCNKKVAPSVR
ncbi:MAG TPA: hypothetical protein PK198_16140 [Saprospiraceae bacterium]|nr:hypothetical protein [Saprospiraceae bacterium]HRJ13492.1 hypothetical protein [Saprospiraceae bacterium]HRK81582.1 hypothetical protein [Saprospiraceae bacterium]